MSKCDVSIHLANAAPRAGGDVVDGVVVVVVDQDVRANHVEVELGWYTHGRGNRVSRTVEQGRLAGGTWSAGRELRLPFRFSIPHDGPVTSRGTLINLDWQVKARVDLPWALDPKATEDFVVVAGPHSQPLLEAQGAVTGAPPSKAQAAWATGCMTPFVLIGAASAAGGIRGQSHFLLLIGLIFLAVSGIFLVKTWKAVLAHAAVGNVSLSLMPQRAASGDEVVFALELPGHLGARVRNVSATLEGSERAVSGSGTKRTTHTETFCEVDVVVTEQAGATGPRFEGRVHLPANTRATLRIADNTVMWQVKVDADIDGLPDPSWAHEIIVVPTAEASGEPSGHAMMRAPACVVGADR